MENILVLELSAIAAVVAVATLLLCLKAPRTMLVVFVFYTLFQDLSLYLTGAGFGLLTSVDLVDELILVGLTLNWVLRILVHNRPFRRTPLDWPVVLFVAYYVLSVLWHRVALPNALLGFRDAVFYVLLFYVLVQLDFDQGFLRRVVKWFILTTYLQLAVLLVQWGLLFARTGAFLLADEAVGLMGPSGAHKLGYFAGTLLLAYLGFFRERVLRQKLLVASLAAIVIISSTRAALFYIPLAVTGLFWRDLWRHRRVRAYWVGTVLALSLMLWGYLKLPETGGATLRPTTLYHQQMRGMLGGRYTRIGFLRYTWNLLQGENSVPWGVGPGWYTSKTASRLGAPYHESLPLGVDATLSQVTTILGEYGLVGSLLIALIYASLYRHVSRVSRRSAHPYLRGISAATAGSLIFYAMSTFSNNVFEIQQVAIIPWLFGGGVVAIAGQLKQRELVEAPGLGERHAPVVGVPGGA